MHGDEFDSGGAVLALLLATGRQPVLYALLLELNHGRQLDAQQARTATTGRWPAFLKHRVKNAVHFISNYESAVALAARQHDVDGVVCGHIHRAEMAAPSTSLSLPELRRLGRELHRAGRRPPTVPWRSCTG
jgi:UDP-2,3-diacylglucosamine pyrophosphatase LpxH